MNNPYWLLASILLILQMLASPLYYFQDGGATYFEDVSHRAGVVQNRQGMDKTVGQAWGDFDNDGWVDLYVTDTQGANTLYHNQQDGAFNPHAFGDQLALESVFSAGATFVDYDNDGWRDLYVLNWGPNVLFRNEEGRGFVDVTLVAGVGDPANGKSAAWGDYDQDGFLDLYVTNWACYPDCGRPTYGDQDRLYHNNGDGSFEDVSHILGSKALGAGWAVSFTDYDNDGDQDIYLVNDEFINPVGNALWRNDGPGCEHWCFTEVSAESRADTQLMGMGLATGDYDNDGDIDMYFSNAGPMSFLQNQGDGTFDDVAEQIGVDSPLSIGWGAVFFDYDNDGWQDLYLAVAEARQDQSPANPLFHNNQDGTFTNLGERSGVADVGATLGVAYADYDRDGWVDLVIGNHDEGYRLYHNESLSQVDNHWLRLQLQGSGSVNRDAIGTRVYVTLPDGSTQLREVQSGSSLGAGNELALHFGLGEYAAAEQVTIVWPNGEIEQIDQVPADKEYTLVYGHNNAGRFWPMLNPVWAAWIVLIITLPFVLIVLHHRVSVQRN